MFNPPEYHILYVYLQHLTNIINPKDYNNGKEENNMERGHTRRPNDD